MDVAEWLRALGLERHDAAFCGNDVDAEILRTLAGDDVMELGIASIGHRRRILSAIAKLQNGSTSSRAAALVRTSHLQILQPIDLKG